MTDMNTYSFSHVGHYCSDWLP